MDILGDYHSACQSTYLNFNLDTASNKLCDPEYNTLDSWSSISSTVEYGLNIFQLSHFMHCKYSNKAESI